MSFATARQQKQGSAAHSPNSSTSTTSTYNHGPLAQSVPVLNDAKIRQSLKDLENMIVSFGKNDTGPQNLHDRQVYVRNCRNVADRIFKEIQNKMKQSEHKDDTLKLSKAYSEQNRKLQKLEQEIREQRDLQHESDDEGKGLLEDNVHVQEVEYQIVRESTQDRKMRLQNAHKSLSNVKNVFSQIAEIATTQVDQMNEINTHFSVADQKTRDASKELLLSQASQRTKLNDRIVIIIVLILCIIGMLLLIKEKSK